MAKTQYHLATTSHDYRRCNKFLRGAAIEYKHLSFPTVMAERNDDIVGIVSTQPRKDMIAAGPVHVSVEGNPTFVFIRLIEAYENVLRAAGVSTYYFFTNGRLLKALDRIGGIAGAEEVSVDDDRTWFRKVI